MLAKTASTAARRLQAMAPALSNGAHSASTSALPEVVIVSATRTPVGSFNGVLKKLTAPELGVIAAKKALEKAGVKPDQVEDVYFGNVLQAGVGQSPARQVALGVGCPDSTEATTINKVCASGMKSITLAAQNLMLGQRSLMLAGGMESMSNSPFYSPRNPTYGNNVLRDAIVSDGYEDFYSKNLMGFCTEDVASRMGITREAQDDFAIESYRRAAEAWKNGSFKEEVAPVTIKDPRKGDTVIAEDEEFKNIKLDKVRGLKPVFKKDGGTLTAANSSSINDGASAVVLSTREKADELGLKPIARIISFADAACKPADFGIAPALAVPIALKRAGLQQSDIAKWEFNEAFSAVALANQQILKLDSDKLNVYGGAVAMGHPIGSSGSRIVVTLVHMLKSGEYGCAAVCNGGGGASAIIIQRL